MTRQFRFIPGGSRSLRCWAKLLSERSGEICLVLLLGAFVIVAGDSCFSSNRMHFAPAEATLMPGGSATVYVKEFNQGKLIVSPGECGDKVDVNHSPEGTVTLTLVDNKVLHSTTCSISARDDYSGAYAYATVRVSAKMRASMGFPGSKDTVELGPVAFGIVGESYLIVIHGGQPRYTCASLNSVASITEVLDGIFKVEIKASGMGIVRFFDAGVGDQEQQVALTFACTTP